MIEEQVLAVIWQAVGDLKQDLAQLNIAITTLSAKIDQMQPQLTAICKQVAPAAA